MAPHFLLNKNSDFDYNSRYSENFPQPTSSPVPHDLIYVQLNQSSIGAPQTPISAHTTFYAGGALSKSLLLQFYPSLCHISSLFRRVLLDLNLCGFRIL